MGYDRSYFYNIEDTTEKGLLILEQIRIKRKDGRSEKGYRVKCLKDGYEFETTETQAKNYGCSVCRGLTVVKGINDVSTIRPDLVKYFKNIDDAYTHSYSSGKKVELICPECGSIKKIPINRLNTQGFGCSVCGDGVSYPSKFMYNLLKQLNIEFIPEYSPEWIKPKRYDFYIPHKNVIIEMDGGLHFINNNRSGQTAEESKNIDDEKDFAANEHEIKVIRIDCFYENGYRFEYIKTNIIKKLSSTFNLSNVDWDNINEKSCESIIFLASRMFNDGMSVQEIAKELKIHTKTASIYLNIAKSFGKCEYTKEEALKRGRVLSSEKNSKKIRIVELNVEFPSLKGMCEVSINDIGVQFEQSGIILAMREGRSYKGFTFQYI